MASRCGHPHCGNRMEDGGLCAYHLEFARTGGAVALAPERTPINGGECAAPTCSRVAHARGLCKTHYARWRRGSSVAAPVRPYHKETPA